MLRQLAARPCHGVVMATSSVVSMTMSRQLPTLRGRKPRGWADNVLATDSRLVLAAECVLEMDI